MTAAKQSTPQQRAPSTPPRTGDSTPAGTTESERTVRVLIFAREKKTEYDPALLEAAIADAVAQIHDVRPIPTTQHLSARDAIIMCQQQPSGGLEAASCVTDATSSLKTSLRLFLMLGPADGGGYRISIQLVHERGEILKEESVTAASIDLVTLQAQRRVTELLAPLAP